MSARNMLPRESVPCDLCGVADEVVVCEAKSLYSEERFRIVRCQRCSLIYVNPRQEERAKLAQIAALTGSGVMEENQHRDTDVYRVILDAIEARTKRRGVLLDVGAATGGLLREARERGWSVVGLEASKPMAEFARTTYDLDVRPGTLEEARFPEASFDVVVMVHTIEHVYHPSRVVAEVFRILKPGGYFYSMTPDFHRFAVRVVQRFGRMKDFDRIDPTAHPYYFTPQTHAKLVEQQGFHVAWCGSPISGLFVKRNGHSPSWARRVIGAAAMPIVWLSRVMPIGSTVQCLAQKPT